MNSNERHSAAKVPPTDSDSENLRDDQEDNGSVNSARGLLITGAPRSGTTWIGRMLTLDDGLFYTHEPFNNHFRQRQPGLLGEPIFPYYRHIPVGTDFPPLERFLDFLTGRSDELAQVDRRPWSGEERRLFLDIQKQRARGAAPLVKDPIAVLSMEWVHVRYGLPVLVMVRHPAEFARSVLRLGWDTRPRQFLQQPEFVDTLPQELVAAAHDIRGRREPVRAAALMWSIINYHVHQVAERHPQDIRVFRHEDIAADPMAGFTAVTEWLGMADDSLLRRIEPFCSENNPSEPDEHWEVRRNSRANRDRWQTYFDADQQRTIREVTEPLSERFGYTF